MNVRFEGNNGHGAELTRCLLLTQSGRFSVLVMELGRVLAVRKLDSNARYRQTDSQTKDRRFDRLQ
jgi:hypothetical protein